MWIFAKALGMNVVDGDTYDFRVDLGFYSEMRVRVRLHDFDTPEKFRADTQAERKHGEEAKQFVADIFHTFGGQHFKLTTHKLKAGKYGRWGAEVTLPDGRDLREMLAEAGMAKRADYNDE